MTELNEETVRAEVRAWLEANWNPELGLVEWRKKLLPTRAGACRIGRSAWYGRDLPVEFMPIVEEEFAAHRRRRRRQGRHPHAGRRDDPGARHRSA